MGLFSPTFNAISEVISYSNDTADNFQDLTTGLDDSGVVTPRACVRRLADNNWLSIVDPSQALTIPLLAPNTVLPFAFCGDAQFLLTGEVAVTNSWYGNDDIRLLGFIRQITKGFVSDHIWINSFAQICSFKVPFGDTIEIQLVPGISGQVTLRPWPGFPPVYNNPNFTGVVKVDDGWFWTGPVSPP